MILHYAVYFYNNLSKLHRIVYFQRVDVMRKRTLVLVILGVIGMSIILSSGCATDSKISASQTSGAEYRNGRFLNTELEYKNSFSKIWDITVKYFQTERHSPAPDKQLPVVKISSEELTNTSQPALYRLGHSTVLIRLDGAYFLTDPVFSDRASPVQWAGPKRFHESPIGVEELPDITAVIISHDHYDHLDKHAIKQLADKVEFFITPLRVGRYLQGWGVDSRKIIEKNWWESVEIDSVTVTATPAQHFSGRGIMDKDHSLWASWVINGEQGNLFFSGDSGYFGGFKEIGERFGPFDITMIETGAYNELWSEIHMMPEQSVQAHIDLKGKKMLPIHNSTFDLALHDWYEPLESVMKFAEHAGIELLTPAIGEQVNIDRPLQTLAWWRDYMNSAVSEEVTLERRQSGFAAAENN